MFPRAGELGTIGKAFGGIQGAGLENDLSQGQKPIGVGTLQDVIR